MITCKECIEFLDDYIAGDVSPAALENFEKHLALCPPCRDFIESYRKTIEETRCACSEPDEQVGCDDVPPTLISAIIESRKLDREPDA